MRIGVFGGTFDPPHNGHLAFAQATIEHLQLDEVQFVPAARNPLKTGINISSGRHRLQMLERLVDDLPNLALCDIEIQKGGNSYSVETMTELSFAQAADYWFLMGADSILEIERWKQPERLLKLCRLAVTVRPPHTETSILARIPEFAKASTDFIPMPPQSISSTEIRNSIQDGKPVHRHMPPEVLRYINDHQLYQLK